MTTDLTVERCILVVDDEPIILELIGEVLAQRSFKVLRASTLAEAHNLIKTEAIDLILSDVSLPDSKQTDLWALLKADRHRDLPVVFMTGYDPPPNLSRRVLIKPFSEQSMIGAINDELNGAEY